MPPCPSTVRLPCNLRLDAARRTAKSRVCLADLLHTDTRLVRCARDCQRDRQRRVCTRDPGRSKIESAPRDLEATPPAASMTRRNRKCGLRGLSPPPPPALRAACSAVSARLPSTRTVPASLFRRRQPSARSPSPIRPLDIQTSRRRRAPLCAPHARPCGGRLTRAPCPSRSVETHIIHLSGIWRGAPRSG
ncbi:hypothetical protein PsYK624_033960 [Phanerochaete sordida]|uniref:Uncharacterized protein n=1 Tax=Phanerochaete sordida TaxID=48140 RepID=A0A9P3LAT5_9APHY|nr:hypothetical protein PsYK624_033960 [Phanerochaete sordida]